MSFFAIYPAIGGGGGGGSGITSINGDTTASQFIVAGTGITVGSVGGTTTITNSAPNTFTAGNLTDVGTDGIVITGGTGAVNGAGTAIAQHVADATHNGYLSSTDWSTFNGKQPAGSYITALTGDATAAGPGSVALTLATVNPNVGTFGTPSETPIFTVNGKGLLTAVAELSIQIAESQVTNLVSDLAAKQSTALTNSHILVGNGSNLATDVAMSGDVTIANTGATTLASVGTAGTYVKVTTDAKGRVISGSASPQAIADGGTGQVTATAAFNALSPLTTKGDLLVYSTTNTREPVGTDGQILIADSTQTTGIKWSAFSASISANIRGSEGGGTVTLTNSDKRTQVFNLSAGESVKLPTTGVLAGDEWEMINANGFILTVQASDATNIIKSWGTKTTLVALVSTPVTFSDWLVIDKTILLYSATSAATVVTTGVTTTTFEAIKWRSGQNLRFKGYIVPGALSGAVNPAIQIPLGLNVDTTNLPTSQANNFGFFYELATASSPLTGGTGYGAFMWVTGSTTELQFSIESLSLLFKGNVTTGIIAPSTTLSFDIDVPILEWSEV